MSDLEEIPEAPSPIPLHRYRAEYRPDNVITEGRDIPQEDDDLPPMSSQPTLLNARNMQRLQQQPVYTLPRAVILNPSVDINTLSEEDRKQIYDYNSNQNNIIRNRNIQSGGKKRKRNLTKKHSKKIRKYKRRKTRK